MLCSEVQLVKRDFDLIEIKPLPCNRWSCDYCGPRRRFQLIAQAISGEPNKILTLTVNPKVGRSALERRDILHDSWKRLVKRILRKYKWKKLPYMAFLEKTKAGEPHLHILLRCGFIHQRWISEQMRQLNGAPIVWIEQVKSQKKAINYVSKYVTKEPAQFGNRKRYWISRGWQVNAAPKAEREPFDPLTTRVVRERWLDTLDRYPFQGYRHEAREDGWHRFTAVPKERSESWRTRMARLGRQEVFRKGD